MDGTPGFLACGQHAVGSAAARYAVYVPPRRPRKPEAAIAMPSQCTAASRTYSPWHCPAALASWVIEVSKALLDLVEGNLPDTSDDFWFIDGAGRHKLPRTGRSTKPV